MSFCPLPSMMMVIAIVAACLSIGGVRFALWAALEAIVAAVRGHEEGAEPGDDLTLLGVRRLAGTSVSL